MIKHLNDLDPGTLILCPVDHELIGATPVVSYLFHGPDVIPDGPNAGDPCIGVNIVDANGNEFALCLTDGNVTLATP